jgi:hypothetical protein
MTRHLTVVVLWAVGILARLAVCSLTVGKPPAWLLSVVLAAIVVRAMAAIVFCVIAARAHRAERRLQYTTWPSSTYGFR